MPFYRTLGYLMIDPDYSYKNIYWKHLSNYYIKFYGVNKRNDPYWVQKILTNIFGILSYNLRSLIRQEKRASFYIFLQNLHENSEILMNEFRKNNTQVKLSNDFPAVRRILKLMLEEATLFELKGHPNFSNEIADRLDFYKRRLEEILYVGLWYFLTSEYIAKSKLFPDSISLGIEDNSLIIYENYPYNHLFDYIGNNLPEHDDSIVIDNHVELIKSTFLDSLGVDYDILGAIASYQTIDPESKMGLFDLEKAKETICKKNSYKKTIVNDFYEGLTLSKVNTPFIDERVLSNQDNHRIIYRPILRLCVDGRNLEMIGYNKWLESFSSLSTNAFPWGKAPEEWIKYDAIANLVKTIQNNHDKVLEEPAINLLNQNSFMFDNNVKSLQSLSHNNHRIDKQGIGEIDIIFINKSLRIIYVCECKHNRSRFDYNNWRRDYSNFINSYENQLDRKVKWCKENLRLLTEHFKIKYTNFDLDFSNYKIEGIFIINAPTLYMFNGKFKAYTLHDFSDLLLNKLLKVSFRFLDSNTNETYVVEHPFFENIKELRTTNS